MLLSIIRYLKGYLKIQIAGYSPERFLNACSHHNIYLWGLRSEHGRYEMYISIQGFRKLKPIIKKTGTRAVITERFGLPFFLHKYRKRKCFFLGSLLCIILIYMMSLFIWDIDISGNKSRTDETLLSFLESKDVVHGMKKSKVDCERIVKDIRKEFDDIIWVSASIRGTRLIVQVKENEDSVSSDSAAPDGSSSATDIVADEDCTITELITRKGTPLVHVGDSVKKGDFLVCGRIEVLDDSKEVVDYQYCASDASIRGKAVLQYESSHSLTYEEKDYSGKAAGEFFVRIGPWLFGCGGIRNSFEASTMFSEEHTLTLGKHFVLPFSYGKRIVRSYRPEEKTYTRPQIEQILNSEFSRKCEELEKKGVEIIENDVKIYTENRQATAKGTITVVMDIGKQVPTERLEVPAKPDDENPERDNANGNDGDSD